MIIEKEYFPNNPKILVDLDSEWFLVSEGIDMILYSKLIKQTSNLAFFSLSRLGIETAYDNDWEIIQSFIKKQLPELSSENLLLVNTFSETRREDKGTITTLARTLLVKNPETGYPYFIEAQMKTVFQDKTSLEISTQIMNSIKLLGVEK